MVDLPKCAQPPTRLLLWPTQDSVTDFGVGAFALAPARAAFFGHVLDPLSPERVPARCRFRAHPRARLVAALLGGPRLGLGLGQSAGHAQTGPIEQTGGGGRGAAGAGGGSRPGVVRLRIPLAVISIVRGPNLDRGVERSEAEN